MTCLGCGHSVERHYQGMECFECQEDWHSCPIFIEPQRPADLRVWLGWWVKAHRELKRMIYAPKSHVGFNERIEAERRDFAARYAIGVILRSFRGAQPTAA